MFYISFHISLLTQKVPNLVRCGTLYMSGLNVYAFWAISFYFFYLLQEFHLLQRYKYKKYINTKYIFSDSFVIIFYSSKINEIRRKYVMVRLNYDFCIKY